MTLLHDVGSLSITSRVYGSLASSHVGSTVASRLYGGTTSRSSSGGRYGSFGSVAGRLVNANLGTFAGTLSAHRLSAAAFPGTVRYMSPGSMLSQVWQPAPPRSRWVAISVSIQANATKAARAVLRQRGQGTVSAAEVPSGALVVGHRRVLAGWLLPGRGSYVVGTMGVVSQDIIYNAWREWDP